MIRESEHDAKLTKHTVIRKLHRKMGLTKLEHRKMFNLDAEQRLATLKVAADVLREPQKGVTREIR